MDLCQRVTYILYFASFTDQFVDLLLCRSTPQRPLGSCPLSLRILTECLLPKPIQTRSANNLTDLFSECRGGRHRTITLYIDITLAQRAA